jgi:thioredoxin reductase
MEPTHDHDWDVLVVGRSYAGLSAALNLGRTRRSVLVVGQGGPRNDAVAHVHGLLTRDGAAPGEIVAVAEAELERYPTVELVDARVTGITALPGGGFRASFGKGVTTAATVVLATGANDDPPPVPGLAERWGRGVFTCPYCDGFEHADLHLAVLGDAAWVPHLTRVVSGWSDRVTALATDLDPAARADLEAHGVQVEDRPVARLTGEGPTLAVVLADGAEVPVGAVFVAKLPKPNSGLAVELGCEVDANGFVVVDDLRRTTVPGVWAIGDVIPMRNNMAMGIADGAMAAGQVNMALMERTWPVPVPA